MLSPIYPDPQCDANEPLDLNSVVAAVHPLTYPECVTAMFNDLVPIRSTRI